MVIKYLLLLLFPSSVKAHTFTGMIGFYDGISHPVLGLDHFLAMVSVGIISALIGRRAIWLVPIIFVCSMIVGGLFGMIVEIDKNFRDQVLDLSQISYYNFFADYVTSVIEIGITLSVILLGLVITIQKKLSFKIIIIFITLFGTCHGTAHGMEMPWAVNPILFASGFVLSTSTLHLFGVGIGIFFIRTKFSNSLLKFFGTLCIVYGIYLFSII